MKSRLIHYLTSENNCTVIGPINNKQLFNKLKSEITKYGKIEFIIKREEIEDYYILIIDISLDDALALTKKYNSNMLYKNENNIFSLEDIIVFANIQDSRFQILERIEARPSVFRCPSYNVIYEEV